MINPNGSYVVHNAGFKRILVFTLLGASEENFAYFEFYSNEQFDADLRRTC